MAQFISGHGDFNSKLKTFRLSEVDTCDCGEEETNHHIIEDCPIFVTKFVTKNVYYHFRQFTRSVLQARKQKRRRILREMGVRRNRDDLQREDGHNRVGRQASLQDEAQGWLNGHPSKTEKKILQHRTRQNNNSSNNAEDGNN